MEEIKSQIKEKYDAIKSIYKSGNVTTNIKESNFDKEYGSTLLKLDGEMSDYKNNTGHYSVGSPELKKQRLTKQLKEIKNNFYKAVIHMDTKSLITIETEIEAIKEQKINDYIKLLESGAVMTADADIDLRPWCKMM